MKNLLEFEKKIKTDFNNKNLLKHALIHRSYINEHPKSKIGNNERLEFLGDAVLELIITKLLYEKFMCTLDPFPDFMHIFFFNNLGYHCHAKFIRDAILHE